MTKAFTVTEELKKLSHIWVVIIIAFDENVLAQSNNGVYRSSFHLNNQRSAKRSVG